MGVNKMEQKRIESLEEMYNMLTQWRNGETKELDTLEKIQDIMNEHNEWEELECRRILNEERKRNSVTIQSTVVEGGRLPLSKIEIEFE